MQLEQDQLADRNRTELPSAAGLPEVHLVGLLTAGGEEASGPSDSLQPLMAEIFGIHRRGLIDMKDAEALNAVSAAQSEQIAGNDHDLVDRA